MKVGGQILWNFNPICVTSQIYYLMERRPMKDVLGGHARIWPNRIWPKPHLDKKSEFGQFVFVTAFGQTAFGQN